MAQSFAKVECASGETCWAERVKGPAGGVLYRIANIPFSGKFNLDDTVDVSHRLDGMKACRKLIERVYPYRTSIRYRSNGSGRFTTTDALYQAMRRIMERYGWCVEGGIEPMSDRDGLAAAAHKEPVSDAMLKDLDAYGVHVKLEADLKP